MKNFLHRLDATGAADEECGESLFCDFHQVSGVGAVVTADDKHQVHGVLEHVKEVWKLDDSPPLGFEDLGDAGHEIVLVLNMGQHVICKKEICTQPFLTQLAGIGFGYGVTSFIDTIPFETEALPTVKTYPINYNPYYYLGGVLFAFAATFLAGFLPARKARFNIDFFRSFGNYHWSICRRFFRRNDL